MTTEIVTGVAVVLITGVIIAVARHVVNSDRHPNKKDIVFKDVCEAKHKGFEDCVEAKINALDSKFDTFREDVQENFKEVKALIKNGH